MDYLKEFQAFAGRVSAAAEDKLAEVDSGTYSGFIRLYSKRLPTEADNTADDEQRQIQILLDELQLAMESPPLLSAPPGTVLHTGAVETGVSPAVGQLCIALEKCLFFGAEGSTPDFWWVIRRASGAELAEPVEPVEPLDICLDGSFTDLSAGEGAGGTDIARAMDGVDITTTASFSGVSSSSAPKETAELGKGEAKVLASTVHQLTRVHTSHGRCRAWVRGLLGVDITSAEEELRRAAEAAASERVGSVEEGQATAETSATAPIGSTETGNEMAGISRVGGIAEPTRGDDNDSKLEPDAGGGGSGGNRGGRVVPIAHIASPVAEDGGFTFRPSGALPLWLHPGPQGASVLDNLCRSLRNFRGRLEERGLSIQSSLDHAWLDQENIAAVTTYTWPSFPRERLRCYVRDAGLPAANGEYAPAGIDEVEGGSTLTLVGPNGCQICRQVCTTSDDNPDIPSRTRYIERELSGRLAPPDEGKGVEVDAKIDMPVAYQAIAALSSAPVAQLWCLRVPTAKTTDKRGAYYSLGDGALPPSRGWRAMEAADMPAPVLGFATQSEVQLHSAGSRVNVATQVVVEEETSEALFDAAIPVVGVNAAAIIAASRESEIGERESSLLVAGASRETKVCNSVSTSNPSATRRSTRRGKRRRPPEATIMRIVEGEIFADTVSGCQESGLVRSGFLESRCIDGNPGVLETELCLQDEGALDNGNDAVAAFKKERWKLPAPSGELLLRAERTEELLQQTRAQQVMVLELRRGQLLDAVTAAEKEYQEVLQEPMAATVERVLAARAGLRIEAEAEAAREAQLASEAIGGKRPSDHGVPSLEELVAEKSEELRTGPLIQKQVETPPPSPVQKSQVLHPAQPIIAPHIADVEWPWPIGWLSAPRAPSRNAKKNELSVGAQFGGFSIRDGDLGPGHGTLADSPPCSIEVAAVEVVDVWDSDAAHIEYVLRVVYREVHGEQSTSLGKAASAAMAAAAVSSSTQSETGGSGGHSATIPKGDPKETELITLATAAKSLLQRTRVLSKRLTSLCALHPQLMWELEEGRRVWSGGAESVEPIAFPDPFELGALEESVLRVHRDKLTPRFKANSPIRKLSVQIESYLSSLLRFFSELESAGQADVRARMVRALNEALSICDRDGRRRRRDDFILGMGSEDVAGGRLGSGTSDEARIREQKRRCKGCRRAIAAEFLGIKKDFFPCRFADGLFCRSYCHKEDRRVIPHRVVYHWDFTAHRVCKDSATFLDATKFLPVINLEEESPRMFVEHQGLRLAMSRRKQLHFLRHELFLLEKNNCTSGARLFDKLLDGRTHLAVHPGLFSLDDLIGVKKGILLDFLDETVETLLAHVADECETCDTRAACVCEVCHIGESVFAFQAGSVVRCPSCNSVFHVKCAQPQNEGKFSAVGVRSSRWRVGHMEVGTKTVCPKCNKITSITQDMGE